MKMIKAFTAWALLSISSMAMAQEGWTLQRCIEYALEHNIQIHQGDYSAEQRSLDYNSTRMNRMPGVQAGLSQNFSFGRSLTANNTYDNTNTTSTSFSIGADVTLFAGGRLQANIKASELSLEAAKSDLERIKDDVRVQVAQAFVQIVYNQSILDVALGQVVIDSLQVERLTALYEVGKAGPAELASQRATLAQSRLSVTQAQNTLQLSLLTLTQLLELPSLEGFEIIAPNIDDIAFVIPQDPEEIYAQAIGIKPSIKSEELRLEQSSATIDVAKSAYYPTLSMSAGAGTNYYTNSRMSSDPLGDQAKNNFNQYVGLNLSIPVYSRNSRRNNVRSAQLTHLTQELQLDNAKKQLYKEIQQAYYNAQASMNRYESSLLVEKSAMESFELVQAKYEGGKSSITEFNESKNRLVSAQADLLKYRYEYLFNTALLEFYRNSSFELALN